MVWCYKVLLRLSFFFKDVTHMKDIKLTVKTSLGLFFIWQISNFMSDAVFLWLALNIIILWPLLYFKKKAEIDRVFGLINHELDKIIVKIPLISKLESTPAEESKKQR